MANLLVLSEVTTLSATEISKSETTQTALRCNFQEEENKWTQVVGYNDANISLHPVAM